MNFDFAEARSLCCVEVPVESTIEARGVLLDRAPCDKSASAGRRS